MEADRAARQVNTIGPVIGVFLYTVSLVVFLGGVTAPVMAVDAFLGPDQGGVDRGARVGMYGLPSLLPLPLGLAMLVALRGQRRDTRQLDASGVRAVAQVLPVDAVRAGGDEEDTAQLTVRISGPGVRTFETGRRIPVRRGVVAGVRLDVVVDPSDHLFAVLI